MIQDFKKIKIIYNIISLLLLLTMITILSIIDKSNNIRLSFVIHIFMIVYLIKIIWGCIIYIREQFKKNKYSYSIIMNLGLVIFLFINLCRNINLFIANYGKNNMSDIYSTTLNSFSYFSLLILPIIGLLAIYSVITCIYLIYKEGFKINNVLGIVFAIFITIGTMVCQYIFIMFDNMQISQTHIFIKKFIEIGINSILCYFYCLSLATLYCNIMASIHKPNLDKDFIIILGSKIKKNGELTPLLKGRVDKAIEFYQKQISTNNKKLVFIPSGGKGDDEIIPEAEAMTNYINAQGIDINNVHPEINSKNTIQNMKYSKEIIDSINKDGKIVFSTTSYHVFRSGIIATNLGIDCEGIGSNTMWYFYANAMIREFFANLYYQKKEHFILITFINIVLFVLIFIGYKYNLL